MELSSRQREILEGTPRLELASSARMRLYLDGQEFTALAEEPSYAGDDGPAVVLELTVRARLDRSLTHKPCTVVWDMGEAVYTGFVGEVVSIKVEGASTQVMAATPSYWSTEPLGKVMDFVKASPSDVLFEAAATVDYPDIDIPPLRRPKITRTGSEALQWTRPVSEVYSAVEEESGLALVDSPLGVALGRRKASIHTDSAPEWVFEEGVDIPDGELTVADVWLSQTGEAEEIEGRYAHVVVYRSVEDSHVELARVAVDNGLMPVHRGSEFLVELSDEDEDDPYELAVTEARRLGENNVSLEFPVTYAPFWLARYEPITVVGREITSEGVHTSTYRARLTSVGCEPVAGSCKAIGALVEESFEPRERRMDYGSHNIVSPLLGRDYLGRSYLSEELGWVSYDPQTGEAVIDTELAEEAGFYVYEANGVVVVSTDPAPAPTGVTWDDERTWEELGDYTWEEL